MANGSHDDNQHDNQPDNRNEGPDDERQTGLNQGLVNYGDAGFSLFLRKAFIKGAGYSDDALNRTIVGIVNTGSGYNPCHG
ncbi:MAG: dihydroxy-acid dehydratase, partial [Pseudomonadota bacterium]|nr:dihydroxy-acid dehydratase [Pseudomonadota bacterium]